jgi:hypothetical protein
MCVSYPCASGAAGAVSWVHAVPYQQKLHDLEKWFSSANDVGLRANPDFMFSPVVHLVRHPLSAITSLNLCFCGCGSMKCGAWADTASWKWVSQHIQVSDKYCLYKRKSGSISVCIKYTKSGRLLRAMEYWVQWNQLIAQQAHVRVQLETVELNELMVSVGLWDWTRPFKQDKFERHSKTKTFKALTWKDLRQANADLAERIWILAQEYGYNSTLD